MFEVPSPPLVGVAAIVANRLLAFRGDVFHRSGDEVGGGEDLEILLGVPTAFRAINHFLCLLVPGDFLKRKRGTEHVFGEIATTCNVVRTDRFVASVETEAAVFPGEHLVSFLPGEEFFPDESLDEAVPEQFDKRGKGLIGHEVEAIFRIDQARGAENVQVRMEAEIISEGLDSSDGGQLSAWEIETSPHPVTQGFDRDVEEKGEQFSPLPKDAAEDFGNRKDDLAVWDIEAN